MAVCPTVVETVHKCQPCGGAWGNVRGSPKVLALEWTLTYKYSLLPPGKALSISQYTGVICVVSVATFSTGAQEVI